MNPLTARLEKADMSTTANLKFSNANKNKKKNQVMYSTTWRIKKMFDFRVNCPFKGIQYKHHRY